MREMLRKLPFALSGMLLISTVNAQNVNDVANQTTSSLTASLNTAKFQAKPIQKVNKEGVMAYSLMLNYSSMEAALYQSALSENFRLYPISEGINAADLTIKAASFIANDKLYRLSEVYDPAEYDYTLSWKVFDISDEEDMTYTELITCDQRMLEYACVDPTTSRVYGISAMQSISPFFGEESAEFAAYCWGYYDLPLTSSSQFVEVAPISSHMVNPINSERFYGLTCDENGIFYTAVSKFNEEEGTLKLNLYAIESEDFNYVEMGEIAGAEFEMSPMVTFNASDLTYDWSNECLMFASSLMKEDDFDLFFETNIYYIIFNNAVKVETTNTLSSYFVVPHLGTLSFKEDATDGNNPDDANKPNLDGPMVDVEVLYSNTIDTKELFEELTILDANNDDTKWIFNQAGGASIINSLDNCNDWIILPAVSVQKDKIYEFNFDYRNPSFGDEFLSVYFGTSEDNASMQFVEKFKVTNSGYQTYVYRFIANADENIYCAVQSTSTDNYTLTVKNFSVKEVKPNLAPQQVSELSITEKEPGNKVAVISGIAPSKNSQEGDLESLITIDFSVKYELEEIDENLDGVFTVVINPIIPSITCTPGQEFSIEVALSYCGNYTFEITTKDSNGTGDVLSNIKYLGNDTPVAPVVTEFYIEGFNSFVEWETPSASVNGGYVDYDNLSYNIYRYPGEILVAEAYAANTFFEEIPTDLNSYYYSVEAVFEGNVSAKGKSSEIISGSGYSLPYEYDFSDRTYNSFYTLINTNKDWNEWIIQLGSKVAKIMKQTTNVSEDWLITPAFVSEEGALYALTLELKTGSKEETFRVAAGNGATAEAMVSFDTISDILSTEYVTYTFLYAPQSSEDINFGIVTDSVKGNITIDQIRVNKIDIPEARNLTSVVNGSSIDLTWSRAGYPSTGDERADNKIDFIGYDIYRDGEKLNSEPITTLSYTDKGVEAGDHVYTVKAVNNYTASEGVSVEATVAETSDVKPSGDKVIVITTTKCGMVRVSGASGASLTVSSAQGIVVADKVATEVEEINVNSGIYLIKVDTDVVKVVVE